MTIIHYLILSLPFPCSRELLQLWSEIKMYFNIGVHSIFSINIVFLNCLVSIYLRQTDP